MSTSSALDTFRRFSPLNSLDELLFNNLCKDIHILHSNQNQTLFNIHDKDTFDYFLVSGQVKLKSEDGTETIIEAGMPNSNRPLSPSRPRKQSATAIGDIEYFSLDTSVLAELNEQKKRQADAVTQLIHNGQLSGNEALYRQFEHELSRGYFVIPSFPETALKIRNAIAKADCDINSIVNLAHSDPGIAAKLIKTANSPLYRGVNPCNDMTAAVMRLGLTTTQQLVTSFAILSLFDSSSPMLKQQMESARQKSISVASYAFILADLLPDINKEQALLSGLLHQLGKIIILNYAEQYHEFDNNPSLLALAIQSLASKAGEIAAHEWGFSASIIDVVAESNKALRETNTHFDYCDLIICCKQICLLEDKKLSGNKADIFKRNQTPAWQKLQQQLPEETDIANFLSSQQEKIDQLKALFIN